MPTRPRVNTAIGAWLSAQAAQASAEQVAERADRGAVERLGEPDTLPGVPGSSLVGSRPPMAVNSSSAKSRSGSNLVVHATD